MRQAFNIFEVVHATETARAQWLGPAAMTSGSRFVFHGLDVGNPSISENGYEGTFM
jgi:hypothetical protein